MRIAIPTNNPGGLDAERSAHFGHCDVFTVVNLNDKKKIESVATIANGGHEVGGCMLPVRLLQDSGVEAIVVGGLGARPMRGLAEAGITVYFADPNSTMNVREVLDDLAANRLPVMHADQACKGSGNCHH